MPHHHHIGIPPKYFYMQKSSDFSFNSFADKNSLCKSITVADKIMMRIVDKISFQQKSQNYYNQDSLPLSFEKRVCLVWFTFSVKDKEHDVSA